MIRKVSRFQTSDGKLFDDEAEAKEHDVRMLAISKLTDLLISSIRTGRVEAVIKEVVEETDAVRDILAAYKRSLPREKKQPEPLMKVA